MVIPGQLGDCAQDGDQDRDFAWLDAGGDVNDADQQGFTLLCCCACGDTNHGSIYAAQMAMARALLARGADVNRTYSGPGPQHEDDLISYCEGDTPLHHACVNRYASCLDMINLLIDAKANVNARNDGGKTPLWKALHQEVRDQSIAYRNVYGERLRVILDIVRVLIRHGASLDCGAEDSATYSAEDKLATFKHADDESAVAIKALFAGVRKHGTYKRYMRAPHREFLALRGLAQRGKLRTDHPVLAFLAKQGDNGVVWHILTYWRPTE